MSQAGSGVVGNYKTICNESKFILAVIEHVDGSSNLINRAPHKHSVFGKSFRSFIGKIVKSEFQKFSMTLKKGLYFNIVMLDWQNYTFEGYIFQLTFSNNINVLQDNGRSKWTHGGRCLTAL